MKKTHFLNRTQSQKDSNSNQLGPDVIILDDSKIFANSISDFLRANKIKVDTYYYPIELLENLSKYRTDIKIIMDDDFKGNISGQDLAKQLEQYGYKKLYVCTGNFDKNTILKYPKGTKIISKATSKCIEEILYECKNP